jgi:GT2 family glycosyltransferase
VGGENAPELSAIVVTPDRLETVRRTVEHLHAQTARDRLEIVMVVPSLADSQSGGLPLDGFARVQWVQFGEMESVAAARAAGIRRASAPIVVLTEDHSYPDPQWAEALIEAHRQPWAAVSPVVCNGNPQSLVSWANFLIDYSEWCAPASAGTRDHLPGHNSSYKRALLLEYGEQLETLLEAESVLHWSLREKGYQLYLEPKAATRHMNYSDLRSSIMARFHSGRLFAATRARGWTLARRSCYVLGSPLIPLVRLQRIARQSMGARRKTTPFARALALLCCFLISDSAGQFFGYAFGVGDAALRAVDLDFHRERFWNARDKQAAI